MGYWKQSARKKEKDKRYFFEVTRSFFVDNFFYC